MGNGASPWPRLRWESLVGARGGANVYWKNEKENDMTIRGALTPATELVRQNGARFPNESEGYPRGYPRLANFLMAAFNEAAASS